MTQFTKPLAMATLAMAAAVLCSEMALAQSRVRQPLAPPLTIQRRSFLDPGVVVPVGSRSLYVAAITQLAVPVYAEMGVGGGFGYYTLPRRFDPPGRPEPLFVFSTGRGGR